MLEDHHGSFDEGSGVGENIKKMFCKSILYSDVGIRVRQESDDSDNYTPHQNISLLTPDYVESHTSSSDRHHDRSVH